MCADNQVFRVTHPFHPQYGREFALLTRRHNWGVDRVYFHDEKGRLASLPTCWTSVAPPDPVLVLSDGRSAFRADDLLELADLIHRLSGQEGDQ